RDEGPIQFLDNRRGGLGQKDSVETGQPLSDRTPPLASRLSLGKIAELHRPRRHPKAFGTPSNSLSGTPSSVPCPRSDACRAKGVPQCVITVWTSSHPTREGRRQAGNNEVPGLPDAGVRCNWRAERGSVPFAGHRDRVRKGSQARTLFCSFAEHEVREAREESGTIPADQRGQ